MERPIVQCRHRCRTTHGGGATWPMVSKSRRNRHHSIEFVQTDFLSNRNRVRHWYHIFPHLSPDHSEKFDQFALNGIDYWCCRTTNAIYDVGRW